MNRDIQIEKLSAAEILRYTSPVPLKVRNAELDLFVQKALAQAPISTSLGMSIYTIMLAYTFYFLAIYENEKYGFIWLLCQNLKFILNCIVYLYLTKKCQNNEHSISNTYLALFAPQIFGAVLWGVMPILVEDKTSFISVLCFTTCCVIVYGNSSSSIGLTWLNFFFACIAAIPTLIYAYLYTDFFWAVSIAALCYVLATWSSAQTIASAIIYGAIQKFQLLKQSELIENFLNEFQINSSDWVWETNKDHLLTNISIEFDKKSKDSNGNLSPMLDFASLFTSIDPNTNALRAYLNENESFQQLVVKFNSKTNIGNNQTWELRGRPVFGESGKFVGFRGFGRDITHIQELNDLNNSKDKFEIMSKFVAKIAHDFNNSLMVIQSSVELLRGYEKDNLSDDVKDTLDTVQDVVKSASRINMELLSFSRQEVLSPTSVDLHNVLTDLIKKYKIRSPEVKFFLSPFSPSYVHADRYALIRTLENLLVNSIEAMNHEGSIAFSASSIDIGAGSQIIFRMEDFGPGFSEVALKSATEPFFTTKKNIGGSGLGMATAAGFAQQSGGEMHWGNTEHGAFVEIKLRSVLPRATQNTTVLRNEPNFSEKCIFVVDDDDAILSNLGNQLKRIFGNVILANSIDEAIQIGTSRKHTIDLMLCDFQFNGDDRNGVDLAELLADYIPQIIFMTGYSVLSDELSNYDVLPKPFSIQEFKESFHAIIERDSTGFRRKRVAV